MEGMTIGEVARLAGLGVETVRFYERKGLVPEPPRRRSGYRMYPPETIPRLAFIRRAKELGFTLAEIGELLELREATGPCAEVRQRAEAKIASIKARIRDLERMRDALGALASSCASGTVTAPCPIIEALDGRGEPNN